MSFSRRTLSLVTILIVFGGLGVGVAWKLLAAGGGEQSGADEVAAAADVPPGTAPAQFSAAAAQPVLGAEVTLDTLWIRVRAAGQAEAFRRTVVTAQVEGSRAVAADRRERRGPGRHGAPADRHDRARSERRSGPGRPLGGPDELPGSSSSSTTRSRTRRVRASGRRIARTTSGLDQRTVDLRQAELRLARTRVSAPFDGRVADLRVVEGSYVTAGTELMTIVDLDPIKVEVQVLEAELGTLAEGRRAEVSFAAFPGELFVGAIETINPLVDPESRTGRVTVLIRNPDGRIKPGMYAEVALDAEALPDRVLVREVRCSSAVTTAVRWSSCTRRTPAAASRSGGT